MSLISVRLRTCSLLLALPLACSSDPAPAPPTQEANASDAGADSTTDPGDADLPEASNDSIAADSADLLDVGADLTDGDPGEATIHVDCSALHATLQQTIEETRPTLGARSALVAVHTTACGPWVGVVTDSAYEAAQPDQLIHIGSVTKTFVAASVLRLAENGALTLEDPVSKWLPEIPDGDAITLRHLLNHTSGLFEYGQDEEFSKMLNDAPSTFFAPEELIQFAIAHAPYFEPGQGFHYASTNYIALGLVIEHVTGTPLSTALHQLVLDPAGLPEIRLDGSDDIPEGATLPGYYQWMETTGMFDPSFAWAAGSVVAGVGDLAEWARQLYAGNVLSDESRRKMLTFIDTKTSPARYGLGVMEEGPPQWPTTMIGHSGEYPGFETVMFYLPDSGDVVVSSVNKHGANVFTLAKAVLQVMLHPPEPS